MLPLLSLIAGLFAAPLPPRAVICGTHEVVPCAGAIHSSALDSSALDSSIVIPGDTHVRVILDRSFSAREERVGDFVRFRVLDPVLVRDRVALPRGTVISAVFNGREGVDANHFRLRLHLTHLTFAGGYSVAVAQAFRANSSENVEAVVALRNGDPDLEAGTSFDFDAPAAAGAGSDAFGARDCRLEQPTARRGSSTGRPLLRSWFGRHP